MPSSNAAPPLSPPHRPTKTSRLLRRRALAPQLERDTPLLAFAVARQVVDEASLFLGVPLPSRYAHRLAARARIAYAQSPSFRRGFRRRADAGRERLYCFLRHWLAAFLHSDRPALFARLPDSYRTGHPLPPPPAPLPPAAWLSPDARPLAFV